MTLLRNHESVAAAVFVALVGLMAPQVGVAQDEASFVVVEGTASVEVAPDFADLMLEIEARGPTPEVATSRVSDRVDAVSDVLEDFDVEEESTSAVAVHAQPSSGSVPGGAGFTASTSLLLRVSEAGEVPTVVRAAVGSGAAQAYEVRFSSSELQETRGVVQSRAFEEARREARRIAEERGLRLGVSELVTIRHRGGPFDVRANATSSSVNLLTVRPEEIVLRAEVTVRWQLLP